jgi:hypothetical protein
MQRLQTAAMSPLQDLRDMRATHGPPLPLDEQLRRVEEFSAFFEVFRVLLRDLLVAFLDVDREGLGGLGG